MYNLFWTSLLLAISAVHSYKILAVLPTATASHFAPGDALMRNLAARGHNVTVISPFPPKKPIKNYRNIDLSVSFNVTRSEFAIIPEPPPWYNRFSMVCLYGLSIANVTLNEPSVQKLMASGETFDLVFVEFFATDALFGLAEQFNAPLVGVSSVGAVSFSSDLVGTPSPPSYVPVPFQSLTYKMTLLQRVFNQLVATYEYFFFYWNYMPKANALFQKYFPNSKLGLDKIRRNTALVLAQSHFSFAFPRPYVPNMIEIAGMHISRETKPLPAAMKKFLDEAKDGVIYFSTGSFLKSNTLSLEKRTAILETFKSLKQRVMWKFEESDLPGKSDNVFISSWFPQNDILAHPNIKLFICQGGLLSITESIYHQKPIIGIPLLADHFQNMLFTEAGGFGITVDYHALNKETLSAAINKILNDPTYTENVKLVSGRYRDQPMEPLDLATYWLEYVARHKGAPHLHSGGQDLNFIQYHNLDAMLVLYGAVAGVLSLVAYFLAKLGTYVFTLSEKQIKTKQN